MLYFYSCKLKIGEIAYDVDGAFQTFKKINSPKEFYQIRNELIDNIICAAKEKHPFLSDEAFENADITFISFNPL